MLAVEHQKELITKLWYQRKFVLAFPDIQDANTATPWYSRGLMTSEDIRAATTRTDGTGDTFCTDTVVAAGLARL